MVSESYHIEQFRSTSPTGKWKETAMKTILKILRAEIPAGAYGRRLTSTEIRDIRAAGKRVSNRAIVQQNRAPPLGIVYNPFANGWSHSGILVEIM